MMTQIGNLVLFLSLSPSAVHTYKAGAPTGQCDAMNPGHYMAEYKTADGSEPFSVTTLQDSYNSQEKITVTIGAKLNTAGLGPTTFKGFMLQARNANGDRVPGRFSLTKASEGQLQLLACDNTPATAVTHKEPLTKDGTSIVTVTWTALPGTDVNVTFVATVVQRMLLIYNHLSSPPISFKEKQAGGNGGDDSGSTTSKTSGPDSGSGSIYSTIPNLIFLLLPTLVSLLILL